MTTGVMHDVVVPADDELVLKAPHRAAYAAADAGHYVFPLKPGQKVPAVNRWRTVLFDIGIATGPSALVVVDLDQSKAGRRAPAPGTGSTCWPSSPPRLRPRSRPTPSPWRPPALSTGTQPGVSTVYSDLNPSRSASSNLSYQRVLSKETLRQQRGGRFSDWSVA